MLCFSTTKVQHHRGSAAVARGGAEIHDRGNRPIILTLSTLTQEPCEQGLFLLCNGESWLSDINTTKKRLKFQSLLVWELTDSNRRPSACKADALNQLS